MDRSSRQASLFRALRGALGASVLWGVMTGSVFADQEVPVAVISDSNGPVRILNATGQLMEYRAMPSRIGVIQHKRLKSANIQTARFSHWAGQIRYQNSSKQNVIAIRFQWKLVDPFDQTKWVVEITDDQGLAPGETRQRRWEQQVSQTEDVVKVLLTVKGVRFQDGTFWPSAPQEVRASESSDAVRMEQKRLRSLYDDKGLEALLRALRE